MGNFQTFAEFLEQRDAERRATDPSQPVPGGAMIGTDRAEPGSPGERDSADRSICCPLTSQGDDLDARAPVLKVGGIDTSWETSRPSQNS